MRKLIIALFLCFCTCIAAADRTYALVEELLKLQPQAEGFVITPFRESLVTDPWRPTGLTFFTKTEVLLAELSYDSICEEILSGFFTTPLIPPIVHMIWLGSPPPETVNLVIASWEKHNPSFEVKLWTDDDVEEFPWSCEHSKMVYETAGTWSEKSDILRFEILYQYGGIYSDTDMVCLNSFEDLLNTGVSVFAGYQYNILGLEDIGSALVGGAKGSSVIKACIEYTQTKEEAPYLILPSRSGPGPTTRAFYEGLLIDKEKILLLPCTYIFPLPYHKKTISIVEVKKHIKPESLAIHLWEGSWMKW